MPKDIPPKNFTTTFEHIYSNGKKPIKNITIGHTINSPNSKLSLIKSPCSLAKKYIQTILSKDLKTIGDTFSNMLRGMHHQRIKYHNDLVQELDKNNKTTQELIPPQIVVQPALDADLEAKLKELENKKNDNN